MANFAQYEEAQIITLGAILDYRTSKDILDTGIDITWFSADFEILAGAILTDNVKWLESFTREEMQGSYHIQQVMSSQCNYQKDYRYWLNIVNECRIETKKESLSKQIINGVENGNNTDHLSKALYNLEKGDSYLANILEWCKHETGVFTTDKLDRELGYTDPDQKSRRAEAIISLKKDAILEDVGDKMGVLRRKATNIVDIDINEEEDEEVKMWLPFALNRSVKIMPKNIIIVAGETNSGKTAFCMNIARFNMHRMKVKYISSEMMGPEFRQRILGFGDKVEDWDSVDKVLCSKNQQDAIIPDALNIIDYLEVYDSFYKIGEDIKKIWEALTTGVAIINIQKKKGAEFARGGEFTLEKARLAFSLYSHGRVDSKLIGSCLVTKAKNGREHHNPTDKEIFYTLENGVLYNAQAMDEISDKSSGWRYYKPDQREVVVGNIAEYVDMNTSESNFINSNIDFYEGANNA